MCITVEHAELSATSIVHFPAPGDPSRAVMGYGNNVFTPEPAANALIFPVHGENVQVLPCPSPSLSRRYLGEQESVYSERWISPTNRNRLRSEDSRTLHRAGNYLVSVATGVEDIPAALFDLRNAVPDPGHVPEIDEELLEVMNRYYLTQETGMPAFVIGAFRQDVSAEHKNPIAVNYAPYYAQDKRIILPALDYHGQEFQEGSPALEPYVIRDHRLLISTLALQQRFAPFLVGEEELWRPEEFSGAPKRFPFGIHDTRTMTPDGAERLAANPALKPPMTVERLHAGMAPNNDYVIDTNALEEAVETNWLAIVTAHDEEAASIGPEEPYDGRYALAHALRTVLGDLVVMQHSNQPAANVDAYRDVRDSM